MFIVMTTHVQQRTAQQRWASPWSSVTWRRVAAWPCPCQLAPHGRRVWCWASMGHGPARTVTLPLDITVHIAIIAAWSDNEHERTVAYRLARTCRAWCRALFTVVLLPRVVLRGEKHVHQFAYVLSENRWGLRELAARCTRHVTVEPARHAQALFDPAVHTRRFTAAIYEPLRTILHICTHLSSLCLHAEPKALALQRGNVLSVDGVRAALQEVVCLQSPWAGDTNDTLWFSSIPGFVAAPWRRLTHLQLHGPRFRMTPRTAASLASLPALSHLALITPHVVDAAGHRNAHDALQTLLDGASSLEQLLLVGHDELHWVGAVRHWRAALAQLERPAGAPPVTITLVTAARLESSAWDPVSRVHASLYSEWMLARAQQGTHWAFLDSDAPCTDGAIAYNVETWLVPTRPDALRTAAVAA